jgi:hypothetical protein
MTITLFSACSDDNDEPLSSKPEYEDLSVQELQTVQTPYQHVFNLAKSAIVTDLKNDDLANVQMISKKM